MADAFECNAIYVEDCQSLDQIYLRAVHAMYVKDCQTDFRKKTYTHMFELITSYWMNLTGLFQSELNSFGKLRLRAFQPYLFTRTARPCILKHVEDVKVFICRLSYFDMASEVLYFTQHFKKPAYGYLCSWYLFNSAGH